MNKQLFTVFLVLLNAMANAQTKHVICYSDGKTHIEYFTKNGLLDGPFTSYYENGQKKAEGKYLDNQRKGNWKVWDAKGNKRTERVYENTFDYKTTSAWDSTGNKCKVRQTANIKYSTVDPAFGYVPYYPVTEKEVTWSKRLWRELTNDSLINKPLFDKNHLYLVLLDAIRTKEITAYGDDEFQNALTYDSIKEYENSIVNVYRIKEDLFYNKTLNLSEYRTIGLCPAMKKSGKTKPLFWLYYPEIRGWLAKHKPETKINNNITNYESIFFKRHFHSFIYKESNVWDREIKDYKKGKEIFKEAERIEMMAINHEFEFWYKYITCRKK
ncbi:MAG TPA: hypothetical protein PKN48_11265 [Bacteroidales bacterium]|nr:hypothetical protein [Bacteroidales bacterium]